MWKLILLHWRYLRTQHHLFLVVNEFEEIVGIITIEDVIEQIIGRKIVDEFDQYADLRAVAKQLARKEAESRIGETI
jgi:CBS domain containing-hemolysin-like protein